MQVFLKRGKCNGFIFFLLYTFFGFTLDHFFRIHFGYRGRSCFSFRRLPFPKNKKYLILGNEKGIIKLQ